MAKKRLTVSLFCPMLAAEKLWRRAIPAGSLVFFFSLPVLHFEAEAGFLFELFLSSAFRSSGLVISRFARFLARLCASPGIEEEEK